MAFAAVDLAAVAFVAVAFAPGRCLGRSCLQRAGRAAVDATAFADAGTAFTAVAAFAPVFAPDAAFAAGLGAAAFAVAPEPDALAAVARVAALGAAS